jgi:hypothetical protein
LRAMRLFPGAFDGGGRRNEERLILLIAWFL